MGILLKGLITLMFGGIRPVQKRGDVYLEKLYKNCFKIAKTDRFNTSFSINNVNKQSGSF